MPIAHQAYLVLVVCGFLTFGAALGGVTWWSNRGPRKAADSSRTEEKPEARPSLARAA
jgi:hypothetical protein